MTEAPTEIDPYPMTLYHETFQRARNYCIEDGLLEVHPGCGQLRLRACEDPETMVAAQWKSMGVMPLPQSEQMGLESRLMHQKPEERGTYPGLFCSGTSHRDEGDLGGGRRLRVFPMIEVEKWGTFQDLLDWQAGWLVHMGFEAPKVVDYRDFARHRGVTFLSNEDEAALADFAPVVQLVNHPAGEDAHGDSWPFFNMVWMEDALGVYTQKCDVVVDGMEAGGSAARESRADVMRDQFFRSVYGRYSEALFRSFGREAVMEELEQYLSLFKEGEEEANQRFGMGWGMTRIMAALAARQPGRYPPGCTAHGVWNVRGVTRAPPGLFLE